MDLIVSHLQGADGAEPHLAEAQFRGRRYRCAVGRTGITTAKTEGDGASPAGAYRLIHVRYRPDRAAAPDTRLGSAVLSREDGWCDDPGHADYNRAVSLPHPARCETLWRDDGLYDIVVITDHNSDPVVTGDGSGIFVHVAGGPDYPPTRGCVAFAAADLIEILKIWNPEEDRLVIRPSRRA